MNLSEKEIESIVAEVVRRLQAMASSSSSGNQASVADKIVTLETLRNHQGKQIRILPDALITPAAHDELRRRQVTVIRVGRDEPSQHNQHPQPSATDARLLAAAIGADYRTETLARLVAPAGAVLEQHPAEALAAVIASHTGEVVRASRRAVWFTSHAAHAVCLANRAAGVWAIHGHDDRSVEEALAGTAANILVVNPRGKSQYVLRRMLEAFVR